MVTRLLRYRTVLIAGAGGGFDVYGGLPLGLLLTAHGVRVHYANFSFVDHAVLEQCADASGIGIVGPDTPGPSGYFPERSLARWLGGRGRDPTVYAFPSTGVIPLRHRYRHLVQRLGVEAIVLVDVDEADAYRDAVAHAARETPRRGSIVNGQIAAALAGRHGAVPLPGRARATDLFVNPLMALYFTFDLAGLARNNHYLPGLESTSSIADVARCIGEFRAGIALREPRLFPH